MTLLSTLKPRPIDNWFKSDFQFNQLYPGDIQQLAGKHWTPLHIAQKAIQFLVTKDGTKVLDIGSGVGKFCLSAAYFKPGAFIYGIEQRGNLVDYAEEAKNILGLPNVSFIHRNFTQLDLKQCDHFYLYNPFFENLEGTDKIDSSILYSESLYDYYNHYLHLQLQELPVGTKVATCCSWDEEIPRNYRLVEQISEYYLKFWIKK